MTPTPPPSPRAGERPTGRPDGARPLRVLLVEPSGYGGVFQHAHNLAQALAGRGHDVALATQIGFETKPYPRAFTAIEVFDRFRVHPAAWIAFGRFLRRRPPDIVHIDGALHPGSYLVLWQVLRWATGARCVYTAQDVVSKKPKPHHPWALRRIYRGMDRVLVNVEHNRRHIAAQYGVDAGRVVAIPTGDLLAFLRTGAGASPPPPAGSPCALFFGFIEPRKGVGTLIRAFAAARAVVRDARLRIAGPPACPLAGLREEIARLGVGSSVSLEAGYVRFEAVPALFADSRVVVLPYETGWSSGVVLTAYGFGRPVVATTVGGLPELVQEGRTGLLVPPRDEKALAAALVRTLGDPLLPAAMAPHIASAAAAVSWDRLAAQTEDVYRDALSAPRHPDARAPGGVPTRPGGSGVAGARPAVA